MHDKCSCRWPHWGETLPNSPALPTPGRAGPGYLVATGIVFGMRQGDAGVLPSRRRPAPAVDRKLFLPILTVPRFLSAFFAKFDSTPKKC